MAKYYTRPEFIETYGGVIAQTVKGTGIFPETLISQAILESQGSINGSFYVGASKLSQNANNYFGIKCSSDWKGKRYNIDTGEYDTTGKYYIESNACFRAYNSVEDSIRDYVKFLQENPRYKKNGVFNAKNPLEQAEALKRSGYATDPNYPKLLTSISEPLKEYIDKYVDYGIVNIAKSFINNPISFVKRNYVPIIGVTLLAIGVTLGAYQIYKKIK